MILRAGERFGIDLAGSFMVGDRWRELRLVEGLVAAVS
jgi:histidinol phosphatase-like enzyme